MASGKYYPRYNSFMDLYDWLLILIGIFMFVDAFGVWIVLRPNYNSYKEGTLTKYAIFFISPLHLNIKTEKSWKRLNFIIIIILIIIGIAFIYIAVAI